MPVFASEQDVYDHIGRLLQAMVADEHLATQFQRADAIVQYRYREPAATITVDARRDSEPCVLLGGCDLVPEVVLSMTADTAHRFFLGHVNVTVALARGDIQTHGPVAKILKMVPLVKPFFPHYRALLQAEGRPDLVPA
ncbi:MAG: sterol carrier protein [Solirubrobacteraceae bacterium]